MAILNYNEPTVFRQSWIEEVWVLLARPLLGPVVGLLTIQRMDNMRGHNWCFTYNNWTGEDVKKIECLHAEGHARYVVFGYERAPTTGTPHLQGYVSFNKQLRIAQVKELIGARAHCELARGTPEQNRAYCTKDDGPFWESGELPAAQGSPKSKIEQFVEWVEKFCMENGRGPREHEYGIEFPQLFVQYRNNLAALVEMHSPTPDIQDGVLKDWQIDLLTKLMLDADDRTIVFMVDPQGGAGKTWFQRYMISQHWEKTQILSIAKRDDIAHAVDASKSIFLFNVPRGGMEFLQYTILEQIKDKMVFSPKYNSKMKFMGGNVHVVVFCNEEPDYNKMSSDRYDVQRLSGGFNEPVDIIN